MSPPNLVVRDHVLVERLRPTIEHEDVYPRAHFAASARVVSSTQCRRMSSRTARSRAQHVKDRVVLGKCLRRPWARRDRATDRDAPLCLWPRRRACRCPISPNVQKAACKWTNGQIGQGFTRTADRVSDGRDPAHPSGSRHPRPCAAAFWHRGRSRCWPLRRCLSESDSRL